MAAKKGRNPFVWIIMILLFVGLLGFGTGNLGGTVRSLGFVGEKEVTIADYQNALNQQLRAFEAQAGQRITFQQARELGLDQSVLGQIIAERALDNEAGALGISVGDERVRDEILRIPGFRDLSGNFDRAAYAAALDQVGQNEGQFEASLRDEIARTLLQGAVVGGVPQPTAYAATVLAFAAESRDITYAAVTADDLEAPLPGPTDSDLQAYYDANANDFAAPEARQITYAWITPEMIQDDLEIDEDTLRNRYDERIAEFKQPERRLVERLIYADSAAADSAAAQLEVGGTTFDALVSDRGLDLSDIDLGDVTIEDLGPAGDAVFAANSGDVVGPIDTDLGQALFRVNAILDAQDVPFEEVRDDLAAEIANARARRVIDDASEGINDLLAGGARLEDLADRTDLTLGTISLTADTQDGIAAYESFRLAADAAEEGAFPELLTLEDGGLFALRLDEITPPENRPLEEVRDAVAEAWAAQSAHDAVLARAEDLAGQISPLTGFATLGLTGEEEDGLLRASFVEGTPPGFQDTVFAMEVGQVRVIDNGPRNGALIVRLDGIAAPDLERPEVAAQLQVAAQSGQQGIQQDIFSAFAAAVQSRTDVQINQLTVDAVNAQLQ